MKTEGGRVRDRDSTLVDIAACSLRQLAFKEVPIEVVTVDEGEMQRRRLDRIDHRVRPGIQAFDKNAAVELSLCLAHCSQNASVVCDDGRMDLLVYSMGMAFCTAGCDTSRSPTVPGAGVKTAGRGW